MAWRQRRLIAALAVLALLLSCWGRGQYVVPVLMYHEVDPRPIGESRLVVSPRSFARQMAFLHRIGAKVVQVGDVVEAFHAGRPLHPRAVAMTFDDGFENVLAHAVPMLRRYGFPATAFIVTDWVGTPGYLTWDQIRALEQAGVTVGSHSVTHPWLPALDDEALRREVVESKRILEEQLGHPVAVFCYPRGAHDERVKAAVRAAGYRGACATNPGRRASDRDPYAVKRIRISKTSDSWLTFWIESSGYYTWVKEHRHK